MASIYSIVYQPENLTYSEHMGDYLRVPVQRASLVAGHGIEGDQKGGHHPDRQLNILSLEWLENRKLDGYRTAPGQFGEQIIISGLAVEKLLPGARLQIGQEVCIEVSKTRNGCERLESAQGKSIQGLGPLGVLAKVTTGGEIRLGDEVAVLSDVIEGSGLT